jgi:hypothetical protein
VRGAPLWKWLDLLHAEAKPHGATVQVPWGNVLKLPSSAMVVNARGKYAQLAYSALIESPGS